MSFLRKAGNDISREFHNGVRGVSSALCKAREDTVAEAGRVANAGKKEVENSWNTAKDVMRGQLLPQVSEAIRKEINAAGDSLKETVISAAMKLLGLELVRYGLILEAINKGVIHFQKAYEFAYQLQDACLNRRSSVDPCIKGMRENIDAAFHPFVSGPKADIINMKSTVAPFYGTLRDILASLDRAVTKMFDEYERVEGDIDSINQIADRYRGDILTTLRDDLKESAAEFVKQLLVRLALGY